MLCCKCLVGMDRERLSCLGVCGRMWDHFVLKHTSETRRTIALFFFEERRAGCGLERWFSC